jgi:cyclophilin family peptidyl-prolyl cis-trans isomerase
MRSLVATTLLVLTLAATARAEEPVVRFTTDYGDIDVGLFPEEAPQSVFGFLRKAAAGAYDNSYIHRRAVNFLLQGGGFRYRHGKSEFIPDFPEPVDEFDLSNERGTLAIARIPGEPRRATDQWFFNLSDNGKHLDKPERNYTVFGKIVDEQGLWVIDTINARNVVRTNTQDLNSAFEALPVREYYGGPILPRNLIFVRSIRVAPRVWPPYSVPYRLLQSMVSLKRGAAGARVTVRGVPEGAYVLARQGDGRNAFQAVAVAGRGPVNFTLPPRRLGTTVTVLPPGLKASSVSVSTSP